MKCPLWRIKKRRAQTALSLTRGRCALLYFSGIGFVKKGQTSPLERHSMKNRAQQIQLFHQPMLTRSKTHVSTPPFPIQYIYFTMPARKENANFLFK
jgi:hypothetical protein